MKLDKPGQGRLAFASQGHPPIAVAKIGVLIANLGTPDNTDYWSMRRYLSEFLSDKRVIDYPRWLWQPLLQLIILLGSFFQYPTILTTKKTFQECKTALTSQY